MTTEAAARLYLAQHLMEWEGKGYAKFNPHNKPLDDLPVIYAFSNVRGGGDGICYAMAQDGTVLGSHWCSHEGYAPHDLGVLEGARPDRHEEYRKHYADGYRMDFVHAADVLTHEGLQAAWKLNDQHPNAPPTCSAAVCLSPRACQYEGECRHKPQKERP